MHKSNPAGKFWKRRWLVLQVEPPDAADGVCVKYFTDASCRSLKGVMRLAGAQVELGNKEVKGPTPFGLALHTRERTFWMSAESEVDMKTWARALGAAADIATAAEDAGAGVAARS
jgi:hypothetical protein